MLTGAPATPSRHRLRGFTLIELMIAVVIAGVLASLAAPAFLDVLRKSRRSEAVAALTAVQQAQERWRADHAAYSSDLSGELKLPATTPAGRYTISVTAADNSSYTLLAVAGGSQTGDRSCASMVLRATAGAVLYGSACTGCAVADPLTDPGRCWSRE